MIRWLLEDRQHAVRNGLIGGLLAWRVHPLGLACLLSFFIVCPLGIVEAFWTAYRDQSAGLVTVRHVSELRRLDELPDGRHVRQVIVSQRRGVSIAYVGQFSWDETRVGADEIYARPVWSEEERLDDSAFPLKVRRRHD